MDAQLTEDPLFLERVQLIFEQARDAYSRAIKDAFSDPDTLISLPIKIQNYGIIMDFILQNRQDLCSVNKVLYSRDTIFAKANVQAQGGEPVLVEVSDDHLGMLSQFPGPVKIKE